MTPLPATCQLWTRGILVLRCFYSWIVVLTSCPTTPRIRPCCTWHRFMDTLGSYSSACFTISGRLETKLNPDAARREGRIIVVRHDVLTLIGLCRHVSIIVTPSGGVRCSSGGTEQNRSFAMHRADVTVTARGALGRRRSCDDKKAIKNGTSARLLYYGITAQL